MTMDPLSRLLWGRKLALRDWLNVLDDRRDYEDACLRCGGSRYSDVDTYACEHVRLRDVAPRPYVFTAVGECSPGEERLWEADHPSCGIPCEHPTPEGATLAFQRNWVIGHALVSLFSTLSEWAREGAVLASLGGGFSSTHHDGAITATKVDPDGPWTYSVTFKLDPTGTPAHEPYPPEPLANFPCVSLTRDPVSLGQEIRDEIRRRERRLGPVPGPHGCTHSGEIAVIPWRGRSPQHVCRDCNEVVE